MRCLHPTTKNQEIYFKVELFSTLKKVLDDSSLSESLLIALKGLDDTFRLLALKHIIATKTENLSSSDTYNFWLELLEDLIHRPRKELLIDLNALSPVMDKLGGEEAILETVSNLREKFPDFDSYSDSKKTEFIADLLNGKLDDEVFKNVYIE